MITYLKVLCAITFVVILSSDQTRAATLTIVDGALNGATDVDVDGILYDVEFLDGTCGELFQNCDETADFTFQSFRAATNASVALLDQVLVDSAEGNFDSTPSLTSGCSDFSFCFVFTPFQNVTGNVDTTFAGNSFIESNDDVTSFAFAVSLSDDFSDRSERVWASWSAAEQASVVPLPAAGWLLLTAASCLFALRRFTPNAA